jgi:hypothetical protein
MGITYILATTLLVLLGSCLAFIGLLLLGLGLIQSRGDIDASALNNNSKVSKSPWEP